MAGFVGMVRVDSGPDPPESVHCKWSMFEYQRQGERFRSQLSGSLRFVKDVVQASSAHGLWSCLVNSFDDRSHASLIVVNE